MLCYKKNIKISEEQAKNMRTYKIFKKQEKHKKQTEWPPRIKRNRIKAVRFEVVVGGGGGGITPALPSCLKLLGIMLET